MTTDKSNQDSQGEEKDASLEESSPDRSHGFSIDAGLFMRNITRDTIYPAEGFEIEAGNLYGYEPDALFSHNSFPVYTNSGSKMAKRRNRLSRQEGITDMNTTRKAEVSRGTILVVSRDPSFVDSLYSIFGDMGYQVVPAETYGYELLGILDKVTPNLAIIDIGMPSMLGVSTALLIRLHTAIPTILLTKWQTGSNTFRKLDVDSPGALSGPITSAELVNLVDSVNMWHEDINL